MKFPSVIAIAFYFTTSYAQKWKLDCSVEQYRDIGTPEQPSIPGPYLLSCGCNVALGNQSIDLRCSDVKLSDDLTCSTGLIESKNKATEASKTRYTGSNNKAIRASIIKCTTSSVIIETKTELGVRESHVLSVTCNPIKPYNMKCKTF